MKKARPHLPMVVSKLAADGWYAKKKYVGVAVAEGLQVVTKLPNMRFRYTGAGGSSGSDRRRTVRLFAGDAEADRLQ